jgi:DDE superfamily endonuclease
LRKLRAYLADNPLRRVAIGGERPSNPGRPWRHLSAHQDLEGVQRSAQGTKLDRIEEVLECWPDRVFAFDEFGPLALHPMGGCCWSARKKPQRLRGNYRKTCGVRQFHACYSVGEDRLWGVVRPRKGADFSLAAIKSCRAARPDGEMIYVILDNLSAHKGQAIRRWCATHHVELCFTPTYSSWANPIECHFGPTRDFVLNNSDHPSHTVLTRRLHAYLAWRNEHASDPALRQRLRRERARLRSERQRRWGRPARIIAAQAA